MVKRMYEEYILITNQYNISNIEMALYASDINWHTYLNIPQIKYISINNIIELIDDFQ